MTNPNETAVEVDGALYVQYRAVSSTIAELKKKQEELGTKLREQASSTGDTVFTYMGQPVYRYGAINQFKSAQFIKENPDAARALTTTEVKEVLDVARIKKQFPGLYAQYQTRRLIEVE